MGESAIGGHHLPPPIGVLHLVTNHRTSTFQIGNLLKIPGGAEMRIRFRSGCRDGEHLIWNSPETNIHVTPFWLNVWSYFPSVVGFWVGFFFSLEKRICWEGEFQCERHETKNPPTKAKATNKQIGGKNVDPQEATENETRGSMCASGITASIIGLSQNEDPKVPTYEKNRQTHRG